MKGCFVVAARPANRNAMIKYFSCSFSRKFSKNHIEHEINRTPRRSGLICTVYNIKGGKSDRKNRNRNTVKPLKKTFLARRKLMHNAKIAMT